HLPDFSDFFPELSRENGPWLDPGSTARQRGEKTMNEAQDPNGTVDVSSVPADALDAALAAGFGRAEPPRSSLGALRPVLLKEAEGESAHVVKPNSDAM